MLQTTTPILPVILCGGMGSRLWPLSRKNFPKQFLALGDDERSLLQKTAVRVSGQGFLTPLVITNEEHRFLVAEHMRAIGLECDIVLEPEGRNTAPAVAAAAMIAKEKYDEVQLLILPSDHLIRNTDAFLEAVGTAAQAAQTGRLVTFGITPEYAETGYGYIRRGAPLTVDGAFAVEAFVEKPNAEVAQIYVDSGEYAWNSGMFLFPASLFLSELQQFEPEMVVQVKAAVEQEDVDRDFIRLGKENFLRATSISLDYAVMERTSKAATVPVDCAWNDAGAWDALWRMGAKDEDGNVVSGSVLARNTTNSYLRSENGATVAALGLENVVVVATPDMVLVADQSQSQQVKQLMEEAGEVNAKWVENHTRVFRPWGFYETIQLGDRYQVKHIQVYPGEKLSVQMHHHRAEHWVIVSGTAKVLCGEEEVILSDNQYIHIPLGAVHCIENVGRIPLDFIEVQHGGYLGEDDIVRFSDRYGRAEADAKGAGSNATPKAAAAKPVLVHPDIRRMSN
jgi:mannose-1-phosphate guanylyltransferase/mannose-6-phosphate isomerase